MDWRGSQCLEQLCCLLGTRLGRALLPPGGAHPTKVTGRLMLAAFGHVSASRAAFCTAKGRF